jgi:uncharacterized protein (TIGR02594 family)
VDSGAYELVLATKECSMAMYRVIASELNLREGPTTNSPIVTRLPQHKILEQLDVSEDRSWYRVRTTIMDGPPVEGWLYGSYVKSEPISIDLPANAPWLAIAEREMGVSEVPGDADNPRILEYLQTTPDATQTDEEAWCAAFSNWCLIQAGVQGTGDARARSFLGWGVALDEPRQGCITVLKRGPNPTTGHVGFYVATKESGSFALLGGNQGNRVTVSSYPSERLLGWRWRP